MAWDAKAISLLDPRLIELRHWWSKVANLRRTQQNMRENLNQH